MKEFLILFSKLSIRKGLNLAKVLGSYFLSRILGRSIAYGRPISIAFEPTTSCNLRCPECPSGLRSFTRPTGMLSPERFHQTIDQLKDDLLYLTFYFQGEPYLNPDFLSMVKYASDLGIFTATSTNAHYLDDSNSRKTVESGLDKIIISIDGVDQYTYEQYRVGGNLSKVLEGTRNLIKWKRQLGSNSPLVYFQFLVVKPNQDQVQEVKKLGKELGVDKVLIKSAQIYEYSKGSDLIPTIDRYSRYRQNGDGTFHLKNKLRNQCWKMWHSSVVTWDGRVVPCCFDKDADHVLGELEEVNFSEIWQGKNYNEFRNRILQDRKKIDICKNCSEGTKIWL